MLLKNVHLQSQSPLRSNVYVSGKNKKILPIPETMQGISTSAESKEERSKKK